MPFSSSAPQPALSVSPLHPTPLAVGRSAVTVLGATALLALCAHIALPLPFTPVPGTMQTFAVLVLAIALGPTLGPIAMIAYFLEGAAGLPVFAPTAAPSAAFFGPTVGYILSYSVAAWVAAVSFERLRSTLGSFFAAASAGVLALVPIFLIGAGWLAITLHLSSRQAMEFGVLPFLPGEVVKLGFAALVIASLHRLRLTR